MGFLHANLMREWLDGARLQYQPADTATPDLWEDIPTCEVAHRAPSFYTDGSTRYRIRPVLIRWRVGLMRRPLDGHFTRTITDLQQERICEVDPHFVRWLTDWYESLV